MLPIQSCWKAQFGIWEHGSCGCSGSMGPGDELAEIWGEVGGKPGGGGAGEILRRREWMLTDLAVGFWLWKLREKMG